MAAETHYICKRKSEEAKAAALMEKKRRDYGRDFLSSEDNRHLLEKAEWSRQQQEKCFQWFSQNWNTEFSLANELAARAKCLQKQLILW